MKTSSIFTFSSMHGKEEELLSLLTEAFNNAFSDYAVKMKMTKEALKEHLSEMSFNSKCSFIAQKGNEIVSFVLISTRREKAWCAGVGTIISQRRKGLAERLFHLALKALKKEKIKEIELECIQKNSKASSLYKKLGFIEISELNCYSLSSFHEKDLTQDKAIKEEKNAPLNSLSFNTTWQNDKESWKNKDYIKLSLNSSFIFAVHSSILYAEGEEKDLEKILNFLLIKEKKIRAINVKQDDKPFNDALKNLGATLFEKQYLLRKTIGN